MILKHLENILITLVASTFWNALTILFAATAISQGIVWNIWEPQELEKIFSNLMFYIVEHKTYILIFVAIAGDLICSRIIKARSFGRMKWGIFVLSVTFAILILISREYPYSSEQVKGFMLLVFIVLVSLKFVDYYEPFEPKKIPVAPPRPIPIIKEILEKKQ